MYLSIDQYQIINMRIGIFVSKLSIYMGRMSKTKVETIKLINAKTSSDSLRATVPSFIVKTLHLEAGDELEWEIESLDEKTIRAHVIKAILE